MTFPRGKKGLFLSWIKLDVPYPFLWYDSGARAKRYSERNFVSEYLFAFPFDYELA